MPLPCSEILPVGCRFSFITMYTETEIVPRAKIIARECPSKADFDHAANRQIISLMRGDDCKLLALEPDGHLAYGEYGDPAGAPIFFFHGWPSSRTMAELTDAAARQLGVRIISPDRPGICDSTFQPNRKLLDWPDILRQLADHLQLGRFHVLAISGGAPYAYVTGWKMPERVHAIAVVSGAPPITELQNRQDLLGLYRLMLYCYRKYPRFSRRCFHLVRPLFSLRPPPRARPLLLKLLCLRPSDAAALRDSAAFEACFESQRRAWQASVAGILADAEIYGQPWGFALEDVDVPVRLWHGKQDRAFSVRSAKEVARRLPNCTARFIDNEGHYSTPIRHMPEILADLIAL
jgi:pimeloyl-ACP methyl ester carboxylesterase